MDVVRTILNACASILYHEITLYGYEVSIMQVIVFGILLVLTVKFIKLFL